MSHTRQNHRSHLQFALRLACAAAAAASLCASAQAMTVSEYGHTLKKDASHAGHAVVHAGSEAGHGVWHAGKTVGKDVAHGVEHGYHATKKALSSKSSQPSSGSK
ncbi:MAG: hypothetical protein KGJ03_08350 [Betaproteobacteria bacterium]|nr:hypothetical protein [Betaproteobacteria bacterium]MBU6512290.1 hypothetical protein [Betaproteobacteria bacterium]MDE1955716.1 hypothetical protein [Betaproteobacteria bacterium]MDE2477670.1 hypothetical protein [Betaproteobacteria bacterium]